MSALQAFLVLKNILTKIVFGFQSQRDIIVVTTKYEHGLNPVGGEIINKNIYLRLVKSR